jgi:creatinine amidohydrolase/Fe(II)-dependent formamide hydrolase-like protein
VFADGHGPSRGSWVENIPEREQRFGLKLFGVTKDIGRQWQSQIDHAARNETFLMMHLRPEWVDLSQLPQSRGTWPQGVGGLDPRDASAAQGKQCLQKSVELVRQVFGRAGLL